MILSGIIFPLVSSFSNRGYPEQAQGIFPTSPQGRSENVRKTILRTWQHRTLQAARIELRPASAFHPISVLSPTSRQLSMARFPTAWNNLGICARRAEGTLILPSSSLQRALQIDPEHSQLHCRTSAVLYRPERRDWGASQARARARHCVESR